MLIASCVVFQVFINFVLSNPITFYGEDESGSSVSIVNILSVPSTSRLVVTAKGYSVSIYKRFNIFYKFTAHLMS